MREGQVDVPCRIGLGLAPKTMMNLSIPTDKLPVKCWLHCVLKVLRPIYVLFIQFKSEFIEYYLAFDITLYRLKCI